MTPRSLFFLGLAIPLFAGGNWFVSLTPAAGLLAFDLVTIVFAAASVSESNDTGDSPEAAPPSQTR